MQALNFLIKNREIINLNVKNSENKTALDKAGSNADMKTKLSMVGARPGSSVEDDLTQTPAYRLISKTIRRICYFDLTNMKRVRGNISDNQRDAYLVAATLILTTIYQSALSPPGGLYQADGSNRNATSSLNSAAGKSVLSTGNFGFLLAINILSLVFAIVSFLILIPAGRIGAMLIAPTFYFGVSYLYSTVIIAPPRETTQHRNTGQDTLLVVVILSGIFMSMIVNGSFKKIIGPIFRPLLKMCTRGRRSNNASNI
ncbi:hypothetical protein PIB30_051075 [Stylosanthes scabra]|uniref:PGG domain-containing protein n=1 Tax=Stylosanthes scabra TaxID=79078 RepID=A0ABU6XFJ1_9FABA|nr:hypothetical protein [Stylosanthes scabra]